MKEKADKVDLCLPGPLVEEEDKLVFLLVFF